ncbi:DUF418 domain-containing protein [Shouchella clausii]|nr:DUF418 domain-containing protein [Shouchella clausii]MEB5478374.1 DUF418 domain-containing protein [Shouchella clausii]
MKLTATMPSERIHELDMIRGIALFGILMANMIAFKTLAFTDASFMLEGKALSENRLDANVQLFISFFVDGKFYPMFSLLFGLGFSIFYTRVLAKNMAATRVFYRRIVFLLMVGLVHLLLLWSGDILYTYALTALLLPLFFHRQQKTLITWTIALILVSAVMMTCYMLFLGVSMEFGLREGLMTMEDIAGDTASALATMANGTYLQIVEYRFFNESFFQLFTVIFVIPGILPLFLIGLSMGKAGMFHDVKANVTRWKRLCWIGFLAGFPLTLLEVSIRYNLIDMNPVFTQGLAEGIRMLAGPLQMLFYVSAFVLLLQKGTVARLFMPIASAGRMALTNYLLQTIVATTIFYGYGFGLFGSVSSSQGLLIAVVIYATQVVLSHLYLKKWKQGPLEALWRKWTYGGGAAKRTA